MHKAAILNFLEKPFSSFCWLEPVLSEEFLLFTSFDGRNICWESILTEEHVLSSQQIIPPQMRRTTKYPQTVWTPTEFSPTNEEKVY